MGSFYKFFLESNLVDFLISLSIFTVLYLFYSYTYDTLLKKIVKKSKTNLDDEFFKVFKQPSKLLLALGWAFFTIPLLAVSAQTKNYLKLVLETFLIFDFYAIISGGLSAFLHFWTEKMKNKDSEFESYIFDYFSRVGKLTLFSLAILSILSIWGVDVSAFIAGVGLVSVILGLALKDTIGNVFSGLSMILDGTLKVGDYVKIESGEVGIVNELGLRSSKILTRDNELIILPNNRLADMKIINYARPVDVVRLKTDFNVSYGTSPSLVIEKILSRVKELNLVLKNPEPLVKLKKMSDNSLVFRVYYWINNYEMEELAKNTVTEEIHKTLTENNIKIPYPQLDLHIKDIKDEE